jgi:penicillin amidase
MAYLDGINDDFRERCYPLKETNWCGKQKFTIEDVYNMMTCPLGFMAQKSDPLMTDIRNKYGVECLKDLG